MPLCPKCSKPLQCSCASAPRTVGAAAESCPAKKPGAIWVHVSDDRGADIKDVEARNDGSPKPSGVDGLAVYDPIPAGKHTVELGPLSTEIQKLFEIQAATTRREVQVNDGEITYVPYTLARKPALKVKVIEKGGAKLFGGATIKVTGKEEATKTTEAATGLADAGRLPAGDYKITASLAEDDQKTHATALDFAGTQVPVTLSAGQEAEVVIEAEPLNLVTPKIEMEYKVVLLDRGLSAHQQAGETKLLADATYIQVSATQTNKSHPFTKTGKLEFTAVNGGGVDVFIDAACTKPLDKPLTAAQLVGDAPTRLWLRGKTKGKFKVKLTLEDPADRFIKLEKNPAEEEMGVVELQMKVHWYVKADIDALGPIDPDVEPPGNYHTALANLALPPQQPLTDQQKVAIGRVLHTQSPTGNHHDRAKVVITKLDPDQWPEGCGNYKITLNKASASGGVALFHAAQPSVEQTDIGLLASYVTNNDVEFQVEGRDACKRLRDIVLDVGIDRAAGGLAKEPKRRGDWAHFTTVKIEEVKLDYVQEAKADNAWDEQQKRYYININQKSDPDGRRIMLSARLSEKIEGIPIHFMLAPDKGNMKVGGWGIDFPPDGRHFTVNADGSITNGQAIKWKDVPVALKHKDRPDRTRLLHEGGDTDKDGTVRKEVMLSRFGGDKFHPAAYILQDPHLAKYVHDHPALGTRKPIFAKVTPVQVWRKVYYQATEPQANELPSSDGFQVTNRKVFLEPELTETRKMQASDFKIDPFRPAWQFKTTPDTTPRLCIGDHNVEDAMKLFVEATKASSPKLHILVCDEQFDAAGKETDEVQVAFMSASGQDVAMSLNGEATGFAICDPPLEGGSLIVSARWQLDSIDKAFFTRKTSQTIRHTGTLEPGNVQILAGRSSVNVVHVTPPTKCGGAAGGCACNGKPTDLAIDAKHIVFVFLKVRAATGPWGGWAPDNTPAIVAKRAGPAEKDNIVQDTLGHELGHKFGQTRHARIPGWPDHPRYYQQRGGSGTHCSEGAVFTADPTAPPLDPTAPDELDAKGKGAGKWSNGPCVLYHSATHYKREWCKHCALDFIYSDLSKFT